MGPDGKQHRFFHGIATVINDPSTRLYFILDSQIGVLSLFQSLQQSHPTDQVLVTSCLMSLTPSYPLVNEDLN